MISNPIQERGLDNCKELLAEFQRLYAEQDMRPSERAEEIHRVTNQLATFHVQRLIDAIHERDGIIHDLQQDSLAYAAGVSAERRRARKIINELMLSLKPSPLRNMDQEIYVQTIFDSLLHRFSEPLTLPLPPDAVRAENVRLRRALQSIVESRSSATAALQAIAKAAL